MAKKKFKTIWFYAPVGKFENVVSEGWFWNKKYKKVKEDEPRTADYDAFSQSIEDAYNALDADGYEVDNIIPLSIGASEPKHAVYKNGTTNYLGDVGFSVTRGAIVVGKLKGS